MNARAKTSIRWPLLIALVASGLMSSLAAYALQKPASKPGTVVNLPRTTPSVPAGREVATLAGGCFWSLEAMFGQLRGVEKVEPGYAGGYKANPTYEQVGTGMTGHAETINVTFDPKVISYEDLLRVFFTVHDPTTLNRQGADEGTNYRSAVFYHSPAQRAAAQKVIGEIEAARIWRNPIVTQVVAFSNYYRAEDYHINYYAKNPNAGYCRNVITPKVVKFRRLYSAKLKR